MSAPAFRVELEPALQAEEAPALTVILPTRNEQGNVEPLLARLERILPAGLAEVVFVDDSDDDTPMAVEQAAERRELPVRLIHREPGERDGGLGGAVVRGLRAARGVWVCVMDADLQHPPEVVTKLLQVAAQGDVDIVVASRFAEGASTDEFGAGRSAVSRATRAAAQVLFPRRLRGVSDPLTGFFLVRRSSLELDRLRPRGFKILLEILIRTPGLRAAEVGFTFGSRHSGESKASLREGLRYARQLSVLRLAGTPLLLARFVAVGGSGLVVNMLAFAAFVSGLGWEYLLAAVAATQLSTLWNFTLTELWVFRGRPLRRSRGGRAVLFFAMNNAMLIGRGPLLVLLVGVAGLDPLGANFLSLVALTVVRFGISDGWIWQEGEHVAGEPFRYSIHGIVTLESPVRLRELERFRVASLTERPTIRVRIGTLSRKQSDLVSALAFLARHIRYDEGLGRFGFGIEIGAGRRTEVLASPLLARSPHVLYTNVVEPIIRWALVRKGCALVHGACIAGDDGAVLITAQTDTGKTTTILRLLDAYGLRFLSDDLTIVFPDGRVMSYPKPLTISKHTVAAISSPLLTYAERMRLIWQSRVHSRSGRRFAFELSRLQVPIATINAIVQWIVPPPKYHIERLVPGVATASAARLARMIVIERGGIGHRSLEPDEAVEILMANSEDAFGFPPYPTIAEFLHRSNGHDLRGHEREIVAAALDGIPAIVLRSETMDWHERILTVAPPRFAGPSEAEAAVDGVMGVRLT
jgi:putative flippase GtrA